MSAHTAEDYYRFQAVARGVHSLEDIRLIAQSKAHIYDRVAAPWLPADRTAPLAELACGHGSFLCWLGSRGWTAVTGIDSSPEQIALARQTEVPVIEADVLAWLCAAPTASQAALIGIDLVEHMPKEAFLELLAEARRVLRPGGFLILRLPNGDSPLVGLNLFNDITHIWTYTTGCLRSLAQMQGYAAADFMDESEISIRDHRWLKVPLHRISRAILMVLFRAASYENVRLFSPHLWARLSTGPVQKRS
jgi:SAM-dependent methyltransferase